MGSKFDVSKEKYETISIFLPVRLKAALDKIAQRHTSGNRSKVIEIVCLTDLEIQAALSEVCESEDTGE